MDAAIEWDFGDGNTRSINGTTAEHTYFAPGTYEVKIKPTVRNGGAFCSPTKSETVVIN